jgi:hypothetical protein
MTQPNILMDLMWRPKDLSVNLELTRGLEKNCHPSPPIYIDDPRGRGDSLPLEHFTLFETCSPAPVWGTFGAFSLSLLLDGFTSPIDHYRATSKLGLMSHPPPLSLPQSRAPTAPRSVVVCILDEIEWGRRHPDKQDPRGSEGSLDGPRWSVGLVEWKGLGWPNLRSEVEPQNTQTEWTTSGGVDWGWWSGVTTLGVECSQTNPQWSCDVLTQLNLSAWKCIFVVQLIMYHVFLPYNQPFGEATTSHQRKCK